MQNSPPQFQRSPRLRPHLPTGEVEIPAPSPAPPEPSVSFTMLLWSVLPGVVGVVAMLLVARANRANAFGYMAYSLPMMAAAYLVQVGLYHAQRRKYRTATEQRLQRYRAMLQSRAEELTRLREAQQAALRELDPSPQQCRARVLGVDHRLWERSPQDDDFLRVRLGLGRQPSSVTVKPPRSQDPLDPDPLCQEAQGLAEAYAFVPGVPICVDLSELGAVGIVGPRPAALNAARQVAVQLAVHHAPDEVKLGAIFPGDEANDWAWLRWLPHGWLDGNCRRLLAAEQEGARVLFSELYELLQRRKLKQNGQAEGLASVELPFYVLFLADLSLAEGEAALPLILRETVGVGVIPIILATRKEELPKECRAIVEVGAAQGHLIITSPGRQPEPYDPDQFGPAQAEGLARGLAPLQLQQIARLAELPEAVPLLSLLGVESVASLDPVARWRAGAPHRSLAVPIGLRTGSDPLVLDLHERGHGPHGLVAGATGSGKSELLQTLVASLALAFHPHEVSFVLIDYKGGGMANAFADLPHLVGAITNLEGNLARRALAALKAELKRRQRLLAAAGLNQIDAYIQRRREGAALPPLPHLILLVDEFAELKMEQPEFMRELVSAVRVGRSLGVHLLLATQKPAGVVDEQIWSNTRFRLALRVERPEDSMEVLKCTDAASLTQAGRAFFQVGSNERFERFQAAWGGAPYHPDRTGPVDQRRQIYEVALGGERLPLGRVTQPASQGAGDGTELEALVRRLVEGAREAGIQRLDGPWLPPLPARISVDSVRTPGGSGWNGSGWAHHDRWMEPVIGLLDDPERQAQEPLRLPLWREGHLAVYGAPGTGKSSFLLSLAISLAQDHPPDQLHLYLVDCGGRNLSMLGELPHVGAVILADESERVRRLLRFLLQELERRKELVARLGVGTLSAYRAAGGEPIAAICLLIDSYPGFASAFPDEEEQVARLTREGGGLGLHVILTATSPALVRSRVSGNITLAAALTLADPTDYVAAVGRTGGLQPAPLPGRALIRGTTVLEFQTALPATGENDWERGAALRALAALMDRTWGAGARPEPVRVLPEVVELLPLLKLEPEAGSTAAGLAAPIGLEVEGLTPFWADLNDGPIFTIVGPPESGKSALLRSWVTALVSRLAPEQLRLWLLAEPTGPLGELVGVPHLQVSAQPGEQADLLLDSLSAALQERRQAVEAGGHGALDSQPALLLVVDDLDLFRSESSPAARDRLEQLIRRERQLGLYLLAAGSSNGLGQYGYDGLTKALLEMQTGFLLGSTEHSDLSLLGLRLPAGEAGRVLAPGLGYYVRRGRYRHVKIASLAAGLPGAGR